MKKMNKITGVLVDVIRNEIKEVTIDNTVEKLYQILNCDSIDIVLKCGHVLIFKWNEYQIPIKEILDCIGMEPLIGNRCGKASKTHWMVFYKT